MVTEAEKIVKIYAQHTSGGWLAWADGHPGLQKAGTLDAVLLSIAKQIKAQGSVLAAFRAYRKAKARASPE